MGKKTRVWRVVILIFGVILTLLAVIGHINYVFFNEDNVDIAELFIGLNYVLGLLVSGVGIALIVSNKHKK